MVLLRRIFFYLFAAAYLAICPLTVLHALGYSFWPETFQGEIIETGLISVSTVPPGATLYVNGRRYTKRTPTVLQGLFPGEYVIRLVLRGHRPWQRQVFVENKKAVAVEKVLMIPERLPVERLLPEEFDELIPIPGTPWIILTAGPHSDDIAVFDVREGRVVPPESSGKLLTSLRSPVERRSGKSTVGNVAFSLSQEGALIGDRPPYRFIESGVRGFETDPRTERILLWKKNCLGLLEFEREGYPQRQRPRIQWLYESGRDIQQVFWVREGSCVLFRDGNKVDLLWLEFPTAPTEILRVARKSSIFYSEETGKLYYLDHETGSPFSAVILPRG